MFGRHIRKILLLRKTSRLDYERIQFKQQNEELLKQYLADHGSDYTSLHLRHEQHESGVQRILQYLKNKNVSVLTRQKENITDDDVRWSDIVIAAGGDGNFLTAASHVMTPDHMVIGINTDPVKSEGYLCITPSSNNPIETIVDNILQGVVKPIRRQRIRVTLDGEPLPKLVLNEAFIGELDPSQAGYFELTCGDSGSSEKLRSSGLLVYTGTGSTSWAYNINKLSPRQIASVLSIAQRLGVIEHKKTSSTWQQNIDQITEHYNVSNVYNGSELYITYVVREPIERGLVSSSSNYYGVCNRLKVRSRSWDTTLIIDGQHHYKFPNGSEAIFTLRPEDSLLTAVNYE